MLGIALIAMGEPLGTQMASRMLEHLLQYGEPPGGCEARSVSCCPVGHAQSCYADSCGLEPSPCDARMLAVRCA